MASGDDATAAANAMAYAVMEEIDPLPRCWMRDVAVPAAQQVAWGQVVARIRKHRSSSGFSSC